MKTDKEKLTLKELAGYLPYKLKCKVRVFDNLIFEIVGLNEFEVEVKGRLKSVTEWYSYEDIFPIVFRISDLTKEITHNGETFLPIEKLGLSEIDLVFDIDILPYFTIQKLYEWHFAINIPEHLYININDLPNE